MREKFMEFQPGFGKVIGKNGMVAEIHRVVGDKYRIDVNGVTKETMIVGFSRAKRKAKDLVK